MLILASKRFEWSKSLLVRFRPPDKKILAAKFPLVPPPLYSLNAIMSLCPLLLGALYPLKAMQTIICKNFQNERTYSFLIHTPRTQIFVN